MKYAPAATFIDKNDLFVGVILKAIRAIMLLKKDPGTLT